MQLMSIASLCMYLQLDFHQRKYQDGWVVCNAGEHCIPVIFFTENTVWVLGLPPKIYPF